MCRLFCFIRPFSSIQGHLFDSSILQRFPNSIISRFPPPTSFIFPDGFHIYTRWDLLSLLIQIWPNRFKLFISILSITVYFISIVLSYAVSSFLLRLVARFLAHKLVLVQQLGVPFFSLFCLYILIPPFWIQVPSTYCCFSYFASSFSILLLLIIHSRYLKHHLLHLSITVYNYFKFLVCNLRKLFRLVYILYPQSLEVNWSSLRINSRLYESRDTNTWSSAKFKIMV